MHKLLYILIVLFFNNCSDTDNNNEKSKCNNTVEVNDFKYHNTNSVAFEIINIKILNDCLNVSIRFAGGCEEYKLSAIASDDILESLPIQRYIKFILENNNDNCEKLITKEFLFDLKPLKIVSNFSNEILLNIKNFEFQLTYEY